jgi:hypothetical protein
MTTQQEGEAVPARVGGDGSEPANQRVWLKRGERPGTIIAAFVRARLLGLQILTLDARVALVPTDRAGEVPATVSTRPRAVSGYRADLAEAVRLLDEGAKALEQVRRVDTP